MDFFHAHEKLVLLAKHQLYEDTKRSKRVERQVDRLLGNQLEKVMTEVQKIKPRNEEAKEAKTTLLRYYAENDDRMQYKTYQEKGLMIGTGPIEAAHRSVIQQRMKLSGQKWTIKGAMANIRCYKQSDAWDCITRVITAAA